MNDDDVNEILSRASEVPEHEAMEAVGPVLEAYRGRIERMLRLRMDHRVAGRVGVSDVMQDAYIEIARRLPGYLAGDGPDPAEDLAADAASAGPAGPGSDRGESGPGRGRMPFFLWVRFLAGQALRQTHRKHLGTLARDAARDLGLHDRGGAPEASSLMLANALVESGVASPSGVAIAEEQREAISEALSSLSAEDREILFMRHFEQLANKEIAAVLGLSAGGASLRHLKALGRLQRALDRFGIVFDAASGAQ